MKFKAIIGITIAAATVAACSKSYTETSDSAHADSVLVDSGTIVEKSVTETKANEPLVDVVDTCMLRIYYPKYSRIDLVCCEMPKKDNDSVILVCAAAYTVKCLDHFNHENIIGNHVSGGKLYKGSSSKSYKGAFSFYDGYPHFAYDNWNEDFHHASSKGGCGFAQDMMIHKGGIINHSRKITMKICIGLFVLSMGNYLSRIQRKRFHSETLLSICLMQERRKQSIWIWETGSIPGIETNQEKPSIYTHLLPSSAPTGLLSTKGNSTKPLLHLCYSEILISLCLLLYTFGDVY